MSAKPKSNSIGQTLSNPFSTKPPCLVLEKLGNEKWYAFDYASPSGVRVFTNKAHTSMGLSESKHPISASGQIKIPQHSRDYQPTKDKIFHASAARNHVPSRRKQLDIWLHISNGCNLNCFYCYIPHLGKEISPSKIDSYLMSDGTLGNVEAGLLNYCHKLDIERLHIKFSGGEPTLAIEKIDAFCRSIQETNAGNEKQIKISFGIITNGVFDFDVIFPVLRKYNFTISVSVDGTKHSHDKVRYVRSDYKVSSGTWDQIWQNIELISKHHKKPYLLYTINESNFSELTSFAELAESKKLGFRLSLVRRDTPTKESIQHSIADALIELYSELGINLDTDLYIEKSARFAEWNLRKAKSIACGSCKNYFAIGHTGGVSSCQMTLNNTYADLNEDSFERAVSLIKTETKFSTMVDPGSRTGTCTKCELYRVCTGGCPQHNANVFGDTDQKSPWCKVYGLLLPHYIRAVANQMSRKLDAANL